MNAQNLVPNSSFEEYSTCPTKYNQFNRLDDWFNATGGSPDYLNVCADSASLAGVPFNLGGHQEPRTGSGYAGLFTRFWGTNLNHREYIEVPLISPLSADSCYRFEMFINLGTDSHITTDAIGIYFSNTMVFDQDNYMLLPLKPQISNNTGWILDTLNWVSISGEYYASGGEKYLTIGNFLDDDASKVKELPYCCCPCAYFFIDDVSLTPMSCSSTSTQNISMLSWLNIYPNPVTDFARIEFQNPLNENCTVNLYNVHGQTVLTVPDIRTGNVEIDCKEIIPGMYFLQISTSKQIVTIGKLIKH